MLVHAHDRAVLAAADAALKKNLLALEHHGEDEDHGSVFDEVVAFEQLAQEGFGGFARQRLGGGGLRGGIGTVPQADPVERAPGVPAAGAEIEPDVVGVLRGLALGRLGGDLLGEDLLDDGRGERGDAGKAAFAVGEGGGALVAGVRAGAQIPFGHAPILQKRERLAQRLLALRRRMG